MNLLSTSGKMVSVLTELFEKSVDRITVSLQRHCRYKNKLQEKELYLTYRVSHIRPCSGNLEKKKVI